MHHSSADQAGRQMPHIIPCTCAPDLTRDFAPQTLCTRRPGEPVLSAAIINCHATGLKPGRDRLMSWASCAARSRGGAAPSSAWMLP